MVITEPLQDLVFKSLTLRGIHGRLIFHTWEETEKLVHTKKINLEPIISHRYQLNQFEKAFDDLISGRACKIIIYPQANSEQPKL